MTAETSPEKDRSQAGEAAETAASGPLAAVLTVFLPFAGGYFISYLFRNVNAVIAPRLVEDLGLGAADLGLLTAAYFLSFAAFQIPLGVLLDRYGPRRVQACLLLVAAAGAAVFAFGQDQGTLMLGRALIGLGVAGGLMAAFKAITIWFPAERWALVNGCFIASGGLGAMASTQPVEALLTLTDWRGIFLGLCLACLAVASVIFLVVPEAPAKARAARLREALGQIGEIYRDALFWRLVPACVTSAASGMAILGLWTGPWLKDVAGMDRDAVAWTLLAAAAAMAVGSILTGVLADLLGRRGIPLERVLAGVLLLSFLAQSTVVFELAPDSPLPWMAFGFFVNAAMLAYPRLARHFPLAYAGRSNAGINVLVFLLAFAIQAVVGWIIELWPADAAGRYPAEAYSVALGAVLALQVAGYLWYFIAPRRSGAAAMEGGVRP